MAVLIPEDISATAVPPGERKFHSFLKILFESRPDVIGWHSVRVCGKEIDFALLLPGIGLFVIEVKDWKHANILSTGPADFTLRTEQGEATKTSPYVQARECGYKVREEIQREPLLCHSSGPNKGKPILPVGHVVVFANIPRKTAQAGPHAARLDPQTTLFEEDLANDGPYLANPKDGLNTFLEFARRALQVTFPVPPLSGPQTEALKKRVFSDSVIKMADPTQRRQSRKVGEVAMDHLQEKYAREIGIGPRLLKGVAGSGKTLVLLQRAIYKAKYDPSAKRILFTCYNLSLANHVRDMVGHNVPEDRRARITVKPFFDLFPLKEMGIDFRGRTHMLPSSYRSTQQIFEFAHRLAGKELPPSVDRETGQMMVFPQYVGRTGLAPVVETFPDPDRLVNHLVTEVRHHIQAEKIPPAEIGILYLSKRTRPETAEGAASPGGKKTLQSFEQLKGMVRPSVEEKSLPDRIASSLKGAGIPVNWFTENSAAKQSFDLHEPTVKIGTIHSAKGLDFEVVYLIDATRNPVGPPSKSAPVDDAARKYRNLLFVGCTRARERLSILSIRSSMI